MSVTVQKGIISKVSPSKPLVIISESWPSWLAAVVAMKLPVRAAYFPPRYHQYFNSNAEICFNTSVFFGASTPEEVESEVIYILSGSDKFIKRIFDKHVCYLPSTIVCLEVDFRMNDTKRRRSFNSGTQLLQTWGMTVEIFSHAQYGGATSARHYVGFGADFPSIKHPSTCIFRGLKHFVNTAVPLTNDQFVPYGLSAIKRGQPVPAPLASSDGVHKEHGFIHYDGLLLCTSPTTPVLCPSVFVPRAAATWIARPLTVSEFLRVYGIPHAFDDLFLRHHDSIAYPLPFENAMSVDIISDILRQLWNGKVGVVKVDGKSFGYDSDLARKTTAVDAPAVGGSDDIKLPVIKEEDEVLPVIKEEDEVLPVIKEEDEVRTSPTTEDEASSKFCVVTGCLNAEVSDVTTVTIGKEEENNSPLFQVGDLVLLEHLHRRQLAQVYARDDETCRYDLVIKFRDDMLGLEGPNECVKMSFDENIFPDWNDTKLVRRPELDDGLFVIGEPDVTSCDEFVSAPTPMLESPMFIIPESSVESIAEDKKFSKAVKSDDAEVPVDLWNERLFTPEVKVMCEPYCEACREAAANKLREVGLMMYRRSLRKDCIMRITTLFGEGWMSAPRVNKDGSPTQLGVELTAMTNILWYASEATWFEHKSGSTLHYFRFPPIYQRLAKEGIPIFFEKQGPTSKTRQAKFRNPAMKKGAKSKLQKVIDRRYIVEANITLKSLIKYFAVPKGDDDIRMVYDATANGLNEAVWSPSFWLPTVESMLRAITPTSHILDRDMGEQFHNFPLHPAAWPYTGLDLDPILDDEDDEDDHSKISKRRWYHWVRCLMGFKPSPYNAVKMTLIAEEVVRGDRHDSENPFQWTSVELNLPGMIDYDPTKSWLYKLRQDGKEACDLFTFVDDERVIGPDKDLAWQAGHRLASIQAYLGIQDAARKLREVSQTPGAWAGSVVHILPEHGVCVLTSPEKWERLRGILKKWLDLMNTGEANLSHKDLLSDRGFLVYVSKTYPAMIPYLKGFHLTIEMWRGNRDQDGWKMKEIPAAAAYPLESIPEDEEWVVDQDGEGEDDEAYDEEVTAINHKLSQDAPAEIIGPVNACPRGPTDGITRPAPRFLADLLALTALSNFPSPPLRLVRGKVIFAAMYGFGDASGKGFGFTSDNGSGDVGYRIGTWGKDAENESSNYRELRNLVETAEEEAAAGKLAGTEFFIFTDNSTAESSFYRGSSSSKLLHGLVLRLRLLEIKYSVIIHLIHVSGTRMIAQGTDGTSRGSLLEGVMAGENMLTFVDLSKSACDRQGPSLLSWIREWTRSTDLQPLSPEEWFVEGHGIIGGARNAHGIWIPMHEPGSRMHLWAPPPAVADVALEELLKARHKRSDTYHIIVIPRLYTPRWRRLFNKACDFTFSVPPNKKFWSSDMFEPLWVGIVLPFTHHRPWQLKRAPLLVDMERQLREVLRDGDGDGRDILLQLLNLNRRLAALSKGVARAVLRMPR